MNISLSKVRQCALSYLYMYLSHGCQPVDAAQFWSIAQEKEVDNLRNAQAKALLHASRSTADTARLLAERVQNLENFMHADLTAAVLREEIARYADRSAQFDAAVKALQYCLNDKRRDTTEQLALCAGDVMRLAAVVEAMGRDLLPRFADFPAYRQLLDSLAAVINRRARMLEVCASLARPEELAGNKEFAGLVRTAGDMLELRPAVEALLSNYSTNRLDVVDKAILYISLYELTENKLDVRIVVSEATALANEFSGSRSAQFIHGVIAAAAKN